MNYTDQTCGTPSIDWLSQSFRPDSDSSDELDSENTLLLKMNETIQIMNKIINLEQSIITDKEDKVDFEKLVDAIKDIIQNQEEKLSVLDSNIVSLTPVIEKGIYDSIHNLNKIKNLCDDIYGKYR